MKQLNLLIAICILFLAPVFAQESNKTDGKPGFIPGEKIIFADDFSAGKTGGFPAQWMTNGGGEIVTNTQFPGRWFQISKGGYYIPQVNEKFTDHFTIDFDFVYLKSANSNPLTGIDFMLISGSLNNPGEGGTIPGNAGIALSPDIDKVNWANWSDVDEGHKDDGSAPFVFNSGEKYHVAFWVQNQHVCMYANGIKILDLPNGLIEGYTYNIFRIQTNGTINPAIANFRIAADMPDKKTN